MSSEPTQPTVFLSYAHDDRVRAQRLAAALAARGYTVWWDGLIEGGAQFAKSIREALEAADAVIVLWSKQSIESDWVCDEAAQGRERHRLVPLSLDGSRPPLGFRQYQTIDLAGWRGQADAPQIEAIDRAIAAACGQAARPAARSALSPRIDRRRALALAGGAGAVVAAGGGLLAWKEGWVGPHSAERTIAVLPFKNLSGDPAQAYLSDGLTEEVRAALARNARLMVLAATSSNTVRDEAGDAITIARKLGVAYLLEGSVQRAGDIVRVATDLTDGRTGFSEWSQRVERPLHDIFAFESEIARTVAAALSVQMATDAPAPGGTRNVKAYEAYLRGRALFNLAKDEASDRQCRAEYENALAADPNFALAHAGLSRILASIGSEYASAAELKPLYGAAVNEARRAIALAPTLAEGHLALGYARFAGQLDMKGARPSYDLAYRYGRGDADIVLLFAVYSVRTRRFGEARSAIERALALDPLNPRTFRAAGAIAYASRRYADAIGLVQQALKLNPTMMNLHALLGDNLMELGRLDEARAAYELEKHLMFGLRGLAVLEYRAGNAAAAQRAFDALVRKVGDSALYQQAEVMAAWGRADAALALLERARAVGDSGLTLLLTDPLFDPIARDPRFVRFVRRLDLT
ncbi:MAG: TIR domain-containing protein [Sphingomicrobium sp.]